MNTYIVLLLIVSFSVSLMNNCVNAFGGRKILEKDYISFDVTSLLSTSCKASVQDRRPGSLEVRHRYGYCSESGLKDGHGKSSLLEILERDQIHVAAIYNNRRVFKSNNVGELLDHSKAANIPDKSGFTLGTGNYIVSVGLGTPAKYVTLEFDTGSSLTWTPCQPCSGKCHPQKYPIFDPSASTSYRNLSCNSAQCSQLGLPRLCAQSTCVYFTRYADGSNSSGFLGNEVLTLTPNDVISNFTFGCGEDNGGLARAGLLGIGPDYFSVVSQTAKKYGKYFSYCLPTRLSESNGHLTFGKDKAANRHLKFTRLVKDPKGQYYFVNLVGISVGGKRLKINPSVFQSGGGTIIDSGTVISRLPPTAYAALRDEYRQQMSKYTLAPGVLFLDTCYDLSNVTNIQTPTITFIFDGNVLVHMAFEGTLIYLGGPLTLCLAFSATNSDFGNIGIFGNTQQQTIEVAYDVARRRLGFASNRCS